MSLHMHVTPYLRSISLRNARAFASTATASKGKKGEKEESSGDSYFLPREDVKTTTLPNITVSSIETNKPLSKLAVYFKAGTRFESSENEGIVNALRIYSGLGTTGASHFGIVRNIQFLGGNFSCTSGREHIAYTVETTRNNIQKCEKFLIDATVNQAFKHWELGDHLPRLKLDLDLRTPEVRALDMLHRAVFRRGLGNSLYAPKHTIGHHNQEMLLEYLKTNFGEASVVGIGLPHQQALDFASRLGLSLKGGSSKTDPSKFYAGAEARKASGADLAYVALAFEGTSFAKGKDFLAAALVQRALGGAPRTKRGLTPAALLSAANSDAVDHSHVSAINTNYSDAGMMGAFIVATPETVEKITKKTADILRGTTLKEEDANRAKTILRSDLSMVLEQHDELLEDLGIQTLHNGKVVPIEEVLKHVDSVTVADMNNALKRSSKLSMAAYGNISNVPYLDELK